MQHEQGARRARARGGAGQAREETGKRWAPYGKFAATLLTSLVTMYLLAFSQIDTFAHFWPSLSVFWISASMIAAMGMIMLVAMQKMLPNRRANLVLFAAFAVLLLGAFGASRTGAGVEDDAFLRSMIPHHSRAIHMCQEAALADPEVIALCGQIVEAQQREIEQMERIIERR